MIIPLSFAMPGSSSTPETRRSRSSTDVRKSSRLSVHSHLKGVLPPPMESGKCWNPCNDRTKIEPRRISAQFSGKRENGDGVTKRVLNEVRHASSSTVRLNWVDGSELVRVDRHE